MELWRDYWARFLTFLGANSVPNEKRAQVFLTNQTRVTYKLLSNLASQQSPHTSVNDMDLDQIEAFMREQFDPTRYVVRERFKFWSEMRRKPGETIQELAARRRHLCFPRIKDSPDEALRTRFMCSVGNEAILKALFKVNDDELTFAKAIAIAVEIEEAVKVAKETVYGSPSQVSTQSTRSSPQSNRIGAGKVFLISLMASGVVAYSPLGGRNIERRPPHPIPNNTTVNMNELVYYIRVRVRGGEL